jgi:hypothetical protein
MTIQARRGASTARDPEEAVRELAAAIHDPEAALTVFYCASSYDLEAVAAAVRRRFGADAPVIGCTTGGEITPLGYRDGSITGVSLRGDLIVHTERIPALSEFTLARGEQVAERALAALAARGVTPSGRTCFGFLLIDGMSQQEDPVVSAIYSRLGDIQLVGGSAGDGTAFGRTFLYHRGELITDSALFTLVHTTAPFHIFKTEHFLPTVEKMVITGADPTRRLVTEINGRAAATEYARMVGLGVDDLSPMVFATHPVVISVGNSVYVRSIQKVERDGSLSFFCAIDEGLVLTVARSVDMVQNLQEAFAGVRKQIGEPAVVLGCDCILRYIEARQRGLCDQLGAILAANNVTGFATYGEQYNAMHLNQTFTGVAVGSGGRPG